MRNRVKKEISVITDLKTQALWFKIFKLGLMISTFIVFTIFVNVLVAGIWLILLFIFGNIVHFTYRWKTKAWTKSWGRWTPLSDKNRQPQRLFNLYFLGSWVVTVILALILSLFV
ncbi:MAG: hypothetical protein ACW98I_13655 [Candidatus Hodarchaeales archaeon]